MTVPKFARIPTDVLYTDEEVFEIFTIRGYSRSWIGWEMDRISAYDLPQPQPRNATVYYGTTVREMDVRLLARLHIPVIAALS